MVESGNPADSERCLPMLRRHVETYGEPPQRVAFDGGYASRETWSTPRTGVEHVMFHPEGTEGARHDSFGMDLRSTEALSITRAVEAGIS